MRTHSQMVVCVVVATTLASSRAEAQNGIVIDWSTRTVVSSPSSLGSSVSTLVTIRNVNDVLYDYQVDISEVFRQLDDFAHIASPVVRANLVEARNPGCDLAALILKVDGTKELIRASDALTPQPRQDKKYRSVPLSETVAAWHAVAPHVAEARAIAATMMRNIQLCSKDAITFLNGEFRAFDTAIQRTERVLSGPHTIQVPVTLRPDADYTIVVTEKYLGAITVDGTKNFVVSPASTVLTLSAGFGVSWIEGRTYSAAPVPGANSGDPHRIQFKVDGTGRRPVVPLLLNYEVWNPRNLDWGWTLSAGPVLAFGNGTTNTSSLGVFGGISFHLRHRFFITPGVHLGEFADFPLGFAAVGQDIPDKFPALTATNRWTSRLAVMVTFRTVDFSKVKPKVQAADPKPESESEEKSDPAGEDKTKKREQS